jgi:hypothetical protein
MASRRRRRSAADRGAETRFLKIGKVITNKKVPTDAEIWA